MKTKRTRPASLPVGPGGRTGLGRAPLLEERGGVEKEVMVLDLRHAADDADEHVAVGTRPTPPQHRAPRRPVVVSARVESQRDDAELFAPPDAEAAVDLFELLRADDDDAVGGSARQRLLDGEEEARLPAAVVAVEDVAVVRVDEAARARAAR